ncbi:MAG TPA: hypothetical protein VGI06_08415 [Acidimicrobiales bacterium]
MVAGVTAGAIGRWFTDASHWRGADGIPHRLAEHLTICGLSLAVAAAVALPVGIVLGHLRKGGVVAENVANLGRAAARPQELHHRRTTGGIRT